MCVFNTPVWPPCRRATGNATLKAQVHSLCLSAKVACMSENRASIIHFTSEAKKAHTKLIISQTRRNYSLPGVVEHSLSKTGGKGEKEEEKDKKRKKERKKSHASSRNSPMHFILIIHSSDTWPQPPSQHTVKSVWRKPLSPSLSSPHKTNRE